MKVVKKLSLPVFSLLFFVACKDNSQSKRNIQLLSDSTAYNNSSTTDSLETNKANAGSYPYYPKNSRANEGQTKKLKEQNKAVQEKNEQNSSTNPEADKTRGWSKGAQGAVIGGATGAVGGAIISKHKGTGAAIGAAVGAAGGYIIGHEKDKKDGRVKKKNN
ncbi:MAG: YMGG-like glycine zipper-containing protein [Ginsengibacter sp.]